MVVVVRYLPPRVNLTRIEYFGKQEETLMSWLITLEDKSAQEDNCIRLLASKRRSRPQEILYTE
jgi:hypothetical protein